MKPGQPKPNPERFSAQQKEREKRMEVGEKFQTFCDGIQRILCECEPEKWWFRIALYLKKAQRDIENFEPQIQAFILQNIDQILGVLKEEMLIVSDEHVQPKGEHDTRDQRTRWDDYRAERTREVIHKIERIIDENSPASEHPEMRVSHISMGEILKRKPENFKLAQVPASEFGIEGADSEMLDVLQVRQYAEDDWASFPLPKSNNMVHKGGAPRVVLKILFGADPATIDPELPPNDFDVIATGDETQAFQDALSIGVDRDGVEMLEEMDYPTIFAGRDISLNCCVLGRNGVTFSDDMVTAAQTGHIKLESEARGLYGSEIFYYDGQRLAKNRGMYRLIKFVAEGKATSFDFKKLNTHVDFGIYWLVMARKFSHKANAGELFNRAYYLGKQMGQVRPGENNIYDVLNRVHRELAFFNFDDEGLDDVGLAQWLNGKLMKYTRGIFREQHHIPSGLEIQRETGDSEEYIVSLDGYESTPEADQAAKDEWENYIENCRRRTRRYNSLQQQSESGD